MLLTFRGKFVKLHLKGDCTLLIKLFGENKERIIKIIFPE